MRRAAAIFLADAVTDHAPEGGAYNQQHQDAARHHDTEGEVQRCDAWNGIFGRFGDLLFRGVSDVRGIALQQQAITEVLLHVIELVAHGLIG